MIKAPRTNLLVVACLVTAACGLPPATTEGQGQGVGVDVLPKAPTVQPRGLVTFSATVTGTANTSVTWTVLEGSSCGTVSTSGAYTAPGSSGACHVVATSVADSSKSATANVTVSSITGGTPRPSYNTGIGFFVLNGKIYDANGVEFQIKGTNSTHWDDSWTSCSTNCGIPNAKFNLNRFFTPLYSGYPSGSITGILDKMISQRVIPLPTVNWLGPVFNGDTMCFNDVTRVREAVRQWVARAALFKPYERYLIINIANEWGDVGTSWRDEYMSAISALRAAGYLTPIVIDGGNCGKGYEAILAYGQTVFDSDPQRNVIFSVHAYDYAGCVSAPGGCNPTLQSMADQLAATGLPIIFGEFGPGTLTNPTSPLNGQYSTPAEVITIANARGFGWAAWAWDDGTGNDWFGQTMNKQFLLAGGNPTNGAYPNNTDLSIFGNEVILNPTFGTFGKAVRATVFP